MHAVTDHHAHRAAQPKPLGGARQSAGTATACALACRVGVALGFAAGWGAKDMASSSRGTVVVAGPEPMSAPSPALAPPARPSTTEGDTEPSRGAEARGRCGLPYEVLAREHAERAGVDPALVLAIMHTESAFNPKARSPVGAMGLMQLMPKVAKAYGVEDAYDPGQNLRGATELLADLIRRHGGRFDDVVAAYNAGGVAVRAAGGIPYPRTRNYVSRVHQRVLMYRACPAVR